MTHSVTTLRLVETPDDVRHSLQAFVDSPVDSPALKKLVRGTSYWIYDPAAGSFGPSKFVGYVGMTLEAYELAKVGNFDGARFDGHLTRRQVERVMAVRFEPSADLSRALTTWGGARFGHDVFDGVDPTKWRFLSLPDSGRVLTPPPGMRGLRQIGERYRPANENPIVGTPVPFEVDPKLVERGTKGHATTQNALADLLVRSGCEPLSPTVGDPDFDIAWVRAGTLHVAEVKSITDVNEEKQLRLGLGQVVWYRHRLADERDHVNAILVVEREPTDGRWVRACADVRVTLIWPGEFRRLLEPAPW